jgi:hypothetical protein
VYSDVAQWSGIRQQILDQGTPIRQVVRESGISRATVRKMLRQPLPEPYQSGNRMRQKLGPHVAAIERLLDENAAAQPSAQVPFGLSSSVSATSMATPAHMPLCNAMRGWPHPAQSASDQSLPT